jgi:Tfp pilus assembly protein PilZ
MSPASQSFRFRESRRLLREVAVRLSALGEDGELSALTRDIATGGMFVSTPAPMPVGAAVHFVLQLGSDDEPADVEGEATVVWVRPEAGGADQPAGMGMQFSRVEPGGEERLALLFSERQAEADVIPPAPAESPPPEPPGDDLPSIDPPLAAEDAAGADEVEATHADLFGELAEDGDNDWMKPESSSRPWLWPAVGGAVILVVALIVLRGPLLQLVGVGGAPTEESAPADVPSFEISTTRAGADVPPEGAEESSTSSRLLVPLEEQAAAADGAAEPAGAAATEAAEGVAAERPAPAPPTAAVETRTAPAAEPAAARPPSPRPSTAAPAAAPANATALRSITVSTTGDRTVIEIVGNAPFQRHHIMPLQAPPRLVVRLIGVREAYDASAVNGPRLRGVRTGVHGRGATRNLHVVLDLAASDIAATVERRGDRVVVNLSD